MSRRLSAEHDRFPLKAPFRIARGVKTDADVIRVEIHENGLTGRGEGVPYPRYGESVESALAQVEKARSLIESGAERAELAAAMPAGAARNALDCALWDLEARVARKSVADLTGQALPARIETALTIGIDRPDAMARAAKAAGPAPLLKVKVDAVEPEAQIRAVRDAAPDPRLIVDPNESWDRQRLERIQPLLVEAGVALLEQPVAAGDDEWLAGFQPAVPICADEAVHVTKDLDRVAGRYQAINIKLDKTGGLTEALELARAARSSGLRLMTGCMVSSSLSITPALAIAAMSEFVDLDGPWWLREDRADGVRVKDGWIEPPDPGFWGGA